MKVGYRRAALLAALWSAAACVSFDYVRLRENEPVDGAALSRLEPGSADLDQCLATLGAPQIVWASETGDVKLAYAWLDATDWGLSVSYNLDQLLALRLAFDSTDERIEGIVLLLDRDLVLRSIERGFLRDLVPVSEEQNPAGQLLRETPR